MCSSGVRLHARVSGQGKENIVEVRRVHGELLGRRSRIRRAGPAGPATTSAAVTGHPQHQVLLVARSRRATPAPPRPARRRSAKRSRTWLPGIWRLSCSGVPSATSLPWSSTAIRSASWSASSRYWVVRKMVVPSATSSRTMSHIVRRLRGSSPVVGSSRKMISGLPDQRHRQVQLAAHAAGVGRGRLVRAPRPARSAPAGPETRCPAGAEVRCRSAIIRRFSCPVSSSSTAANCPVTPIAARTCFWSSVRDVVPGHPHRSGVGLHQAWSARSPWSSCRRRSGRAWRRPIRQATSKSMPSSTTLSPYVFRSPVTAMAAFSMTQPSRAGLTRS